MSDEQLKVAKSLKDWIDAMIRSIDSVYPLSRDDIKAQLAVAAMKVQKLLDDG